ncbi:hypothetical protein TPHA_0G03040 [Tetrapisispora phaffii CBS 4417]|uniref:Protein KTI12 n=1 Tax=Tetrapisispora phaffii (strain ATCC 24235 / CBS 4417 / NBRC 1672 / NRRL Y-8282 / UCD 70-5) TaxID=1071381 RepID=G8BW67_TETPH|nr:hypothetical protein TPHA_0G03040 [Tetrapisispora phaffii CBS 4417]CCE64145.1 hypothetical protein TPHA_0G03040 [Tetrapisispora phaffii CBS 4417]
MPLILFSGYPCSGKTTKAKELIELLEEKIKNEPALSKYKIVYHSDETLGIKHENYANSHDERKLRSEIMSAVKRDLSKTNIVIVDSLNYIKGFRYQLHCEVKNSSSTFCLIQTMCPVDVILEWNTNSPNPWDETLLTQLIQRYEEPNGLSRWDSPLFAILSNQDTAKEYFNDISSAIFTSSKSLNNRDPLSRAFQKPNSVTLLKPASQTNFMQMLDMETTRVVKTIMNEVKIAQSIGSKYSPRIIVSEDVKDINEDGCVYVDLPVSGVTLPLLQRLKRQFISLNKVRDMEKDRIVHLFADYLTKHLNE